MSRPRIPMMFFTALFLALLLVAWFNGRKAQARANSDENERVQVLAQSHTVDDGLWLCTAPLPAKNLEDKIETSVETGITLTRPVLDQIVASNFSEICKRADADNFKPIGYLAYWGTVGVAGGPHGKGTPTIVGWTPMNMYLAYMRSHVVRKES